MLQQLHDTAETIPLQHRILRQLVYPTMSNREEAIHDAGIGTCKWILEEEDNNFYERKALYDSETESEDSLTVNVGDGDNYVDVDGGNVSEDDGYSDNGDEKSYVGSVLTKTVSTNIGP